MVQAASHAKNAARKCGSILLIDGNVIRQTYKLIIVFV